MKTLKHLIVLTASLLDVNFFKDAATLRLNLVPNNLNVAFKTLPNKKFGLKILER